MWLNNCLLSTFPKEEFKYLTDNGSSVGTRDVATLREKCSSRFLHSVMFVSLKRKTCNFIVILCMFFKGAAFPVLMVCLPFELMVALVFNL